jgi:hypothetical protein
LPTSEEKRYLKSGKAIHGGPDLPAPRATRYCDNCKESWMDPDDLVEQFKPTERRPTCYFCQAVLRPHELLRYEIDAEEYKESVVAKWRNDEPAKTFLQPETFADRPNPVCDECRSGIHENECDRQAEEAGSATRDRFAMIVLSIACTAFVMYLLAGWILHDFVRR